jgi:hypothetical protein
MPPAGSAGTKNPWFRNRTQAMTAPVYEQDRHAWATHTATLLRQGRLGELDIANLTEEIDSMGASEQRELYSRLRDCRKTHH